MTDEPVCSRPGCGHAEEDHDDSVLYCMECSCTGYIAPDSFESEPEEVTELHLGEEG